MSEEEVRPAEPEADGDSVRAEAGSESGSSTDPIPDTETGKTPEEESSPPPPEGWFSRVRFAIPFGRYESADEQEPPAHEVMVGREGQRAFFLDLLLNSGRRGAFLVTGRRGSGKSSFVRHCLAEYEDEVYQRFLRSNVGRTLFWDRIILALVWLVLVFVALLLTDLLEIIGVAARASARAASDSELQPVPGRILLQLLGIPIIILCAYPWLYGREIFERIFRARLEEPGRRDRRAAIYAIGLSTFLALAAFYFGPFGAPALGMSRLLVAFTFAMFWVYATNYDRVTDGEEPVAEPPGERRNLTQLGARILRSPLIVLLPALAYLWGGFGMLTSLATGHWPWAYFDASTLRVPRAEFTGDLGLALTFGAGAALLRFFYLRHNPAFKPEDSPLRPGAMGYLLLALFQSGVGVVLLAHARPIAIWPPALVLIAVSVWTYLRFKRRGPREGSWVFRPRPLVVLAAKAAACTVVAVQLLNPLLCDDNWVNREIRHLTGSWSEVPAAVAWTLYPDPATARNRDVRAPFPQALLAVAGASRNLPVDLKSEPAIPEPLNASSPAGQVSDSDPAGGQLVDGQSVNAEPAGADSIVDLSFGLPEFLQTAPLADPHQPLFTSTDEEVRWLFVVFLFGLMIYACEYEWIVRPFYRHRIDRSFDPKPPAPFEDTPRTAGAYRSAYTYRMLARVTFFWTIHHVWSPLLISSVNLGFERLDHRRVVQAMLIDLRERYYRRFVAWNSIIGNVIRVIKVLILIVVVALAGRHWFKLPEFSSLPVDRQQAICAGAASGYGNICDSFRGHQGTGGAASMLCSLDSDSGLFHLTYFNFVVGLGNFDEPPYSTDNLLLGLLPFREKAYPPPAALVNSPATACQGLDPLLLRPRPLPLLRLGFEVRTYHLLLLGLFFVIFRWITARLPLPPYRHTLARIDAVLDGLSSRRSRTSKRSRWGPIHWVRGFLSNEQVEQLEQEPIDPRITEIAFLTILRDINASVLRLPGARDQVLSLPAPELIFVFDELDKLGTRVDPATAALAPTPQKSEEIDAERRRSLELHQLLADMKNMLSSSDARFVFVGGRNLHDEWLADQTARQPLLTNIFNAEVYLPSLLTDGSRGEQSFLHLRVEHYLRAQKHRADALHEQTAKVLWRPELLINSLDRRSEAFVQRRHQGSDESPGERLEKHIDLERNLGLQVLETTAGESLPEWGSDELLTDLVFFLAWRSLGNAKRLKELLATFIRPASRFIEDERVRWDYFDCRHVLALSDTDRFRLQLIAGVYRHLTLHFEQSLVNRDDKLAVSTFYLADFLFKFHDRAFSWGNLERVDELVHIHRAPDLRQLLENMVGKWSQWVLHPIRNAMYGFRFRSDFAREVSYLSRQSPDEMAAFNFTLDESQELKMLYSLRIRRLESDAHGELAELYGALGELHEFDQEYEDARLFYRRALASLDQQHEQIVGTGGLFTTTTHHMDLLSRAESGLEAARQYMVWGIGRLRLMLQIAMTYERAREFERAGLKYRDARSLSNALLVAMLDDKGREAFRVRAGYGAKLPAQSNRLHTLKNLNIIFQPIFAEGWVAEKYEGGVDTGVALLETQLSLFREVLPFVRSSEPKPAADTFDIRESNFALIVSELHNKLGDTYFFRGKQPMTRQVLGKMTQILGSSKLGQPKDNRVGSEGYLMRSYYHYALGLHELRRYITYRRRSSAAKFNIMYANADERPDGGRWETIDRMGWPDFVFRAIGDSLNDLSEATLARVSLYGLLWTKLPSHPAVVSQTGKPPSKTSRVADEESSSELFKNMLDWFEGRDEIGDPSQRPVRIHSHYLTTEAGTLSGWFGRWNGRPASESTLLDFDELEGHHDPQRLLVSLELTRAGAEYLEKGGYFDEAADEQLEICATVTRMIWWYSIIKMMVDPGLKVLQEYELPDLAIQRFQEVLQGDLEREKDYWAHLFDVAWRAFKKADQLLRLDRRAPRFLRRRAEREEETERAYLVGSIIPPRVLVLACSLGAACSLARDELLGDLWDDQRNDLCELITSWTGKSDGKGLDYFVRALQTALVRHPYPMLSRLQGLKALIDTTILRTVAGETDRREKMRLKPKRLKEALGYVEELQFLEAQYASPLHFTPLEMGVSLALVDLRFRSSQVVHGATAVELDETQRHRLAEIRSEAKRYLQQSSEAYTMRRAYYENIQRLYYLYDDFNDRQIHFNLAMQMTGSEICLILSELVDLDLPPLEKPPDPPTAGPSPNPADADLADADLAGADPADADSEGDDAGA